MGLVELFKDTKSSWLPDLVPIYISRPTHVATPVSVEVTPEILSPIEMVVGTHRPPLSEAAYAVCGSNVGTAVANIIATAVNAASRRGFIDMVGPRSLPCFILIGSSPFALFSRSGQIESSSKVLMALRSAGCRGDSGCNPSQSHPSSNRLATPSFLHMYCILPEAE